MKDIVKILFIDLDHTLITTKSGDTFPRNKDDWKFKKESLNKLKEFFDFGYRIAIVTNQGGIDAGYVNVEDVEQKLQLIKAHIVNVIGHRIEATRRVQTYYTGSIKKNHYRRKPNAGMAYEAARYFHSCSLKNCIMVGDLDTDREFAINAGIGHYIDVEDFANCAVNNLLKFRVEIF